MTDPKRRISKKSGDLSVRLPLPKPNKKQREFFLSRKRYTAYGGARAGGKSWAVRVKALAGALFNPGIRILIMRRTYPELEATMIGPLLTLMGGASAGGKPGAEYLGAYNATQRTVFFTNGSTIKFGHLQNQSALTEYQGQEYDWIFLDEATHFTEYEFRTLGACLRGVNGIAKRMYLTCNPGGVGHAWVKRLFVNREYDLTRENPDDYFFIPATVDDNTALSGSERADYIAFLELLPEDIRAAHRYGDWDALAGQFFCEFRRGVHTCSPFPIPREWPRYRVFDYGLDLFACYWAAIDCGERIWVYREYCEKNLYLSDAANAMRALTPEDEAIEFTIAPPDMWNRRQETGRSAADIFTENGVGLVKCRNARAQGWLVMKEFFKMRKDGKPGIVFFEDCDRILRDIPALLHDEDNPNDISDFDHSITHGPDAIRYLCMYRALGASGGKGSGAGANAEDGQEEDYDEAMRGGEATQSYLNY